HLEAEPADALGQRVGVVARLGTEDGAAAHEDRRLPVAVAGAARALLRPDLRGRAGHHAARLGRGGAAAALGELPGHALVEHGLLGLGQVEGDLAVAADHVDRARHQLTFLFEARTSTSPPFGPGTAPLTRIRLSSGRTSTISRPTVVTRSAP